MRCLKWTAAAVMLAALCAPVFAASWAFNGDRRNVVNLIVCTNNKSPRLMAELIQAESKQPYLLLPAPGDSDTRVFFVPAQGQALELPQNRVIHFIRVLNPRRVVILNGDGLVIPRYKAYFDDNIPVVVMNCRNWERTAQELSYMLNVTALARDYKKLRDQMLSDAQMYRPISEPAPQTPAEPKVEESSLPPVKQESAKAEELPPVSTETSK